MNATENRRKTLRFLWSSFVCLALLCVGVFVWITHYMVRESDKTITEVVNLYMEEMNLQLQRHFNSLVNMRLIQVGGITQVTPPESVDVLDEKAIEALTDSGRSREFVYLALYDTEGEADVIYGEEITVIDERSFLDSLNRRKRKLPSVRQPAVKLYCCMVSLSAILFLKATPYEAVASALHWWLGFLLST